MRSGANGLIGVAGTAPIRSEPGNSVVDGIVTPSEPRLSGHIVLSGMPSGAVGDASLASAIVPRGQLIEVRGGRPLGGRRGAHDGWERLHACAPPGAQHAWS